MGILGYIFQSGPPIVIARLLKIPLMYKGRKWNDWSVVV